MSGRVLQQLLASGEYDEFDDIIMVEGEFIEFNEAGYAIRQVLLGTSPSHLIKATRNISDYKKIPEVFYETDIDFYLEGLELVSVVPLCLLTVAFTFNTHELDIGVQGDHRFYLLCNTRMNGDIDETWQRWKERVEFICTDPYHYIRNMLHEHNLPYPDNLIKLELEESQERKTSKCNNVELDNSEKEDINDVRNCSYNDSEDSLCDSGTYDDSDQKITIRKHKMKRRKKKRVFSWKFLYIKRRR